MSLGPERLNGSVVKIVRSSQSADEALRICFRIPRAKKGKV
jgi:DNA-directed RNA polymerase subunit H (RpoH/RPB5)